MPTYEAGDARLRIVPDASGFRAKLEADLRKIRAEYAVAVTADLARARADIDRFRAEQQANPVNLRVKVDRDGLRRELGGAFDELARRGSLGDVLKLNLGAAGVSLLPGLATGLADVAAALQQVAQAGIAVPGILAGVGSSISALVVGLTGVKDAYTAVTKASSDSGESQARQARAAAQASNELRNAVVDETQAQRDRADAYREARQQLEDLNLEVRGGQLDEQQAMLDAQKARRDLYTGQYRDALDLQEALLRVQQADQRVAEAHQHNLELQQKAADANTKGIAGSDQVVQANERVVRSQQRVADAQAAVADAAQSGSSAASKAADAMAKLAPNAREFVETLISVKPQLLDLRNAVQQNLFAGMSQQLRRLIDADLPNLKTGLGGIASAWNTNIKQLVDSVTSSGSRGLLDRILGDTADAQNRFTKAIDPIVHAMGTLTAAGSDTLPRMADAVGQLADRFDNFITAADKDGRLQQWINEGLSGFDHLGHILLDLGKSFTAVTKAAGGGEGLWGTLDKATQKLSDFLNSDRGQTQLRNFFQQARDDLKQWQPIFADLLKMLPSLLDASRNWMNAWLPLLREAANLLANDPKLVKDVVVAFAAWKTIAGVASLIDSLKKITDILSIGIPTAAERGATGAAKNLGRLDGILRKLGLLAAAGGLVDLGTDLLQNPGAPKPPSPGAALGGAGADIAGGAMAGGALAGPPGALVGGALGGGKAAIDRAQGDLDRQKAEAQKRAEEQRRQHANDTTGPYAPPKASGPSFSKDLLDKVRRGQLPGYSLSPDGKTVIGPNGKPVVTIGPDGSPVPIPGMATGGPTPHSPGPGPTGGYLAEVHPSEYMVNARGRAVLGDDFLRAANLGMVDISRLPRFDQGGPGDAVTDPYGNPITPGKLPGPAGALPFQPGGLPGPAPVAPNPMGGGGLPSILGNIGSGLQGPIGNAFSFGNSLFGGGRGSGSGGSGIIPGLWGLAQVGNNPMGMQAWMSQTGQWLSNFAAKTVTSFGGAILQGALGIFGLQNSILSPSNPYNQAFGKTFNYYSNLLGGLGGSGAGMSVGAPGLGMQSIQLGDGSTIQIPTFGTAQGASLPGLSGVKAPSGDVIAANPASVALSVPDAPNVEAGIKAIGGLPTLYPTSGEHAYQVPQWAQQLAQAFGLTASTYATGGSLHQMGFAFDFNGPPEGREALAQFISQNLRGQTLQLIYRGKQDYGIASGKATPPSYYAGDLPGHTDHVHWATDVPVYINPQNLPGAPGAATAVPGSANPSGLSSAGGLANLNWDALAAKESGGNWQINTGNGYYGGLQFDLNTWKAYKPPGAPDNPAAATKEQQIQAAIKGIIARGGAHTLWPVNWGQLGDPSLYDDGGYLPLGLTLTANNTAKPEAILPPDQTQAFKDLAAAAANPAHPLNPNAPQQPQDQVQHLQPPAQPKPQPKGQPPQAPQPPAAPPPQPENAPPPPEAEPLPQNPILSPIGIGSGKKGTGVANSELNHVHPALQKGITSAASTIGSLVAMAISSSMQAAAAAGSFGAAGAAGGMAGGSIGSFVAGAIQEGGKVAVDLANVPSSFLVGNITTGTKPVAYGETLRPQQNTAITAPTRVQNNTFNGMDVNKVFQELDVREAQQHQAALAARPRISA